MKKYLWSLCLCVPFLTGCKKENPQLSSEKQILSFQISTGDNIKVIAADINFSINDTLLVGISGDTHSRTRLIANFSSTGAEVTVNGVIQETGVTVNDFSNPVVYTVIAKDRSQKRFTVKLKSFTGLPIFYITTDAPVVSKDDYVNGTLKIDGNQDFTDGLYDGIIQIKGRGNSTWYQDKKPYKIKLDKKSIILGMPADKEWALLANYLDKSLLRNDAACQLSEILGMDWTPRRRFVEVFVNGEFNGNYLLIESVKSGPSRINIDLKNGGYFVEFNYKAQEGDPRFYTTSGGNVIPVDVKESSIPIEDIKRDVDSFNSKILNWNFDPATGYQLNFNLDQFVSWYIVNEYMINNDACFYSSVYLQKNNATAKLQMGPVWDFDMSSGNVNYGQVSPEGWYLKERNVVQYIWNDPYFQAAVKAKWNKYRSQLKNMTQYIEQKGNSLQLSANQNFIKWNILNVPLSNTVFSPGSYQGEVDYFKDWLGRRFTWMDNEINK
jgi:hypothetical protein